MNLSMRGRHLVDTSNGRLWPWTETLSRKPGFKLVQDEPKEYTGPEKFNDLTIETKPEEVEEEMVIKSVEAPTESIRVTDGIDTTLNLRDKK